MKAACLMASHHILRIEGKQPQAVQHAQYSKPGNLISAPTQRTRLAGHRGEGDVQVDLQLLLTSSSFASLLLNANQAAHFKKCSQTAVCEAKESKFSIIADMASRSSVLLSSMTISLSQRRCIST